MAEPLFINQQKLEALVEEGKVTFQDNVLTILAERKSYELAPAVKITGLLDGVDTEGLVGKAWTVVQIEDKGGEQYRDSVILGETAYQCEEGFMGTSPERTDPTPAPVEKPEEEKSDADLLTDFLLKHL